MHHARGGEVPRVRGGEVPLYVRRGEVPPYVRQVLTTGLDWLVALAGLVLLLNEVRSKLLFSYKNSLADLWMLAAEFTDGEIAVPEEFREAAQ